MTQSPNSHEDYIDEVFKDLKLQKAELVLTEFHQCEFRGCSLVEAVLRSCRFVACRFEACDLSLMTVLGSAFVGVDFEDCTIVGVNWATADWSALNQGKALSFHRCAISHSTFMSTPLKGGHFTDCVAKNADFREADLAEVDFSGTDLSEALFQNTNLRQADLSKARGYAINPDENVIAGAKFSLPEAMALLYNMDIELVTGDGERNPEG